MDHSDMTDGSTPDEWLSATAIFSKNVFLRRHLQQQRDGGGSGGAAEEEEDPYEFVAFLLWYVFLVLCCIVPTCCAYRRRRIIERRMAEQQANMQQFQQANLFFLNNPNGRNAVNAQNEEALQQERHRLLTDALKPTTMTISESDLKEAPEGSSMRAPSGKIVAMHGGPEDDQAEATEAKEQPKPQEPEGTLGTDAETNDDDDDKGGSADVMDDLEMDMDNNLILCLPARRLPDSSNDDPDKEAATVNDLEKPREVAGNCTICLCQYEAGDQVTWAADGMPCPHAFHTECIIGWLSKKEEPNCPVCRQPFCPQVMVPLSAATAAGGAPLLPPPLPRGGLPGAPASANGMEEIPFPFSRSLAETVALARYSMAVEPLPVPAQQEQATNNNSTSNIDNTSTRSIGRSQHDPVPAAEGVEINNNATNGESVPDPESQTIEPSRDPPASSSNSEG